MVFMIIIATVVIQSLTAIPIVQWLGLRSPEPNGFLMFGSNQFARELAKELNKHNIAVTIADTNWDAISQARMQNLKCYYGNPMSDHAERYLDLSLVGTVLVLSPYRQLNPLVTTHFEYALGKENTVLGLTNNDKSIRESHQVSEQYARKLSLFGEGVTYGYLANAMSNGAVIKTTQLTVEFTYQDYLTQYASKALPLLYIDNSKVGVFTIDQNHEPKPHWKIISLIKN
jgi:hypothetical protein